MNDVEKNHEERLRNLEAANLAVQTVLAIALKGRANVLEAAADSLMKLDARDTNKAKSGMFALALKHVDMLRTGVAD
jgi:hypothetical protein